MLLYTWLSTSPPNQLHEAHVALTSHAHQLIAEAGLETSVNHLSADYEELIFQQDLDLDINHGHWDEDIDVDNDEEHDVALDSVDHSTASAIYWHVNPNFSDLLVLLLRSVLLA